MAVAALPIAASVLSAGATAATAAGISTTVATIGTTAITVGNIASVLSAAGTLASGVAGLSDASSAASAARAASEDRAREIGLANQRERTQAAIEEAERQRRLRRALAAQRARFSGAGVDFTTGTPQLIQDQTAGQINRESRIAGLRTDLATSSALRQQEQELRQGGLRSQSIRSEARTGLLSTAGTFVGQARDLGKVLQDG